MRSGGGNARSWWKRVAGRASSSRGSCSSTGSEPSSGALLLEPPADPGHEPAHPHQLRHELGKRLGAVLVAGGEVTDHALAQVDLQLVALADRLGRLRRLEDRVAEVDRVA